MKNTKVRNQLELWLFCAIIGAFVGGLVWALLKVLAVGTEVIWEWIPGRFSIPFFLHPKASMSLKCLETCIDADNPCMYDDCTAGEYLNERLIEIGLKK